jgi:hypothetical protein
MPWWLPASDERANRLLYELFQRAIESDCATAAEQRVFSDTLSLVRSACETVDGTLGEAVHTVMEALHRRVVPALPRIRLRSLTRSPARVVLADSLRDVRPPLQQVIDAWMLAEQADVWSIIAVGIGGDGEPTKIRARRSPPRFEQLPLTCVPDARGKSVEAPAKVIESDELCDLLRQGHLVPGSRLVALAEVGLLSSNVTVRHFGNSYGRQVVAGQLCGVLGADQIPCYPDDKDSWHWAIISDANAAQSAFTYPVHLLDVLMCSEDAQERVPHIISASLMQASPVRLPLLGSLNDALLAGRA